jgi:hypothetical protein
MKPNIQVIAAGRGLTIQWCEEGLERHVWVEQASFERFLASGETIYLDAPALAVKGPRAA